MRHTTLYHLRALLRPLKRRAALPRSNGKGKGRAIPCSHHHHHHHHHQSHSGYDPLLPDANDDDAYEGEAIELLPPARIVTDPCLLVRPTSAPGPSSLTPPPSPWARSSSSRPPHFSSSSAAASTCTLASSSSTSHPSSFGPSTPSSCSTTTTYTGRPVSAVEYGTTSSCHATTQKKSRRETWTKSLMALDSLFFVTDDDNDPHTAAAAVVVDASATDRKRPSVRETKRDSFMWMKFDGHTGGAVAWADGVRLAGGLGV